MSEKKELYIAIACTMILFAVTISAIVWSVVRYIKKSYLHKQELVTTEMEVQEHTRKNLASELHDNIGQILSLTSVLLGSIHIPDNTRTTEKIKDAQALVKRSIGELRQLSRIIQGEQLIREGLAVSIQQEINWLERSDFYSISFFVEPNELPRPDPEKDLFLFRLLQESLNNTIKHSSANAISIELFYRQPDVIMSILDNGIGFDVKEKLSSSKGLGLQHMRKRIGLLNGTMQIESMPGKGTQITFVVPYA